MLNKIKYPYRMNWRNYKLFCYRNGLAEGDYNNLKKYIERR